MELKSTAARGESPWVVNPIQLNQVAASDASEVIAMVMSAYCPPEKTIARARLIARAPDLREMLEMLREACADGRDDDVEGILLGDVCYDLLYETLGAT